MGALADAWSAAVVRLGGDGTVAARELEHRYAQPHRRYHGSAHVQQVLRDCAWLAGELDLPERERAVLALAACAHDVVYDAEPGVDERASADWARAALRCLPQAVADRVSGLVLLTIEHAGDPGDAVAAALLDADLAILAAPGVVYDTYVTGVRAEYAAVSDDQWQTGRARVLRALLAHEPLFLTEPGRRRWEAAARDNLVRELGGLAPG